MNISLSKGSEPTETVVTPFHSYPVRDNNKIITILCGYEVDLVFDMSIAN